MAAMKPRTGDGPLEVTKEGRGIVMRVPLEGGGRLVVELNADEADGSRRCPQGRGRLRPIPTFPDRSDGPRTPEWRAGAFGYRLGRVAPAAGLAARVRPQ